METTKEKDKTKQLENQEQKQLKEIRSPHPDVPMQTPIQTINWIKDIIERANKINNKSVKANVERHLYRIIQKEEKQLNQMSAQNPISDK